MAGRFGASGTAYSGSGRCCNRSGSSKGGDGGEDLCRLERRSCVGGKVLGGDVGLFKFLLILFVINPILSYLIYAKVDLGYIKVQFVKRLLISALIISLT